MALVLCGTGFLAWRQFKPTPPPPPPPPPAVVIEATPVISEAEQAKVIRLSRDPDAKVRWEALVLLDKLKVTDDIVFERLHKDSDPELRIKLIELLGHRAVNNPPRTPPCTPKKAQEIIDNIISVSRDPIPEIRLAALQSLQSIGDYTIAPRLMESLKDVDERVRTQALQTLSSLQDKKAAVIEAERRRQAEAAAAANAKQ
jgi:HEAT repeat protein